MKKKNLNKYLVVAGIVILACIGAYYSNTNTSLKNPGDRIPITNFRDCVNAGYPVEESAPRRCRTPEGGSFVEDLKQAPPITNPITVSGVIDCLPKTGSGEQTLECATGMKGSDGKYYGLKNLYKLDPDYKFSRLGLGVIVTGTFSTVETAGPDGNRYDTVGDIDVASIREDPSTTPQY